jgi:hypothetical protein
LSDWVPQVQAVAREWIPQNFNALPLAAVRLNQQLILYLSRKERIQGDPAFSEINRDLLARAQSMTKDEFFEFEPMFRRYLFSLSLNGDQTLRNWILDDKDPFNRLLLLSCTAGADLTLEELERLRNDESVFVRRRYFYWKIERGIQPMEEELKAFALDPNQGVRELGRYYLKKFYGVDGYEIYKTLTGQRFYYIADYAKKEDAEHFLQGVRSGRKYIQYICLRALAISDNSRIPELDLESLIRGNRRLKEIVARHIPRLLAVDEILALRKAFEDSSPNGAFSFLRALEKKSYWAFLDIALDYLVSNPSSAVRNFIIRCIHSKVQINEELPALRRTSIEQKIQNLRLHPPVCDRSLIRLLEFSIGTP